jgi:AcrR family transcriptional regulator
MADHAAMVLQLQNVIKRQLNSPVQVNKCSFMPKEQTRIMNGPHLRLDEIAVHDSRVDEILMLARHAFVEKGFDGASMQDLARAAGMSAGNFYRYFSSKAAIVDAMVARDLDDVEREFAKISRAADPMQALREQLQQRISGEDYSKDNSLWAEIIAAAARRPEVAAVLNRMECQICRRMTQVFGMIAGTDDDTAYVRYSAHARLVFMLVRGAALENTVESGPDSDLATLIMRIIDGLVNEIVQDASGDKT